MKVRNIFSTVSVQPKRHESAIISRHVSLSNSEKQLSLVQTGYGYLTVVKAQE